MTGSSQAYSHAGVQKRGDNTIVTMYQYPISPIAGEKVKFTFVVSDFTMKQKRNVRGTLTLVDTYYGDESRDKKIFNKQFTTDANGAFAFEHTFQKENYFSINLQFDNQQERWQHIDFLVQPRKAGIIIRKIQNLRVYEALGAFGFGCVATLFAVQLNKYYRRKSK